MSTSLRITLLFTLLVVTIWALVCGSIYYFSYKGRITTIKTRLSNRAITTARLLQQSEIFSQQLIQRIDSSTMIALYRKSVQAYLYGVPVYYYSDVSGDTLQIEPELLEEVIADGTVYFTEGARDAVAFHNTETPEQLVVICAAEDREGKSGLRRLTSILIICFIGGTFISFVGGYFFSKTLLRPVKQIAHEVKDISAYSLDRRIKESENKDEWNYLTSTLNHLLDRLKESFEIQRRFISNASHELSTPLTVISSQLEISLQRNRSEEDYRRTMQLVLEEAQHMSHLVQTLLKFATASGDAGGLNIDLVRIDEVLMRLPAEMKKKDKQNGVSLLFKDLPDDENSLLVLGNEELLFTAISNIVINACKYSDDHLAKVSLVLKGKEFVIQVVDKGIGINPKEINNIFQPFYRAESTSEVGGFGLGLPLASRIIKLHKGNLSVSSVVNQGSVFTIVLPAAH